MSRVDEVRVEVLTHGTEGDLAALARLLPQVSSSAPPLTDEWLGVVLREPTTVVLTASVGDQVVGMAVLCVCTTLAGRFGLVEEVAVTETARGRHVSVHLMVRLLAVAAERDLRHVELTTRASRVAANELYKKLGFKLRETNCYRHELVHLPAAW